MRKISAAFAAGVVSMVIHAVVVLVSAATGGLPALVVPLAGESIGAYALVFMIQAVLLVAAYLMIGEHLPGGSRMRRGLTFGALLFVLGSCLPLVPRVLIFSAPLAPGLAVQVLVAGALVSFANGLAFVAVWEAVMLRVR